jgi:hypothetical protein
MRISSRCCRSERAIFFIGSMRGPITWRHHSSRNSTSAALRTAIHREEEATAEFSILLPHPGLSVADPVDTAARRQLARACALAPAGEGQKQNPLTTTLLLFGRTPIPVFRSSNRRKQNTPVSDKTQNWPLNSPRSHARADRQSRMPSSKPSGEIAAWGRIEN